VAQEYTVEQLNHGRKVWDFMRWDYWAFGISGFLLIVSIAIIGVRGFNWGLDFTGGTVIEITLEKPVDLDQMRDSLQKAGFEEPQVQENPITVFSVWISGAYLSGKSDRDRILSSE